MREIIVNQRNQNTRLLRENQLLRKQNGRLRTVLRHLQTCKQADLSAQCCTEAIQHALGEAIP